MLNVRVRRRADAVDSDALRILSEKLPSLIARTFSRDDESEVRPDSVLVRFEESSIFDNPRCDLEFSIEANAYPSRVNDHEKIVREVTRDIEDLITSVKVMNPRYARRNFVQITLRPIQRQEINVPWRLAAE